LILPNLLQEKFIGDPGCGHRVVITTITLNLNPQHSVTYCIMLGISDGPNDISIERKLIKIFLMLINFQVETPDKNLKILQFHSFIYIYIYIYVHTPF
jgi:hypothetical protein